MTGWDFKMLCTVCGKTDRCLAPEHTSRAKNFAADVGVSIDAKRLLQAMNEPT